MINHSRCDTLYIIYMIPVISLTIINHVTSLNLMRSCHFDIAMLQHHFVSKQRNIFFCAILKENKCVRLFFVRSFVFVLILVQFFLVVVSDEQEVNRQFNRQISGT